MSKFTIEEYSYKIREMLTSLKSKYGYSSVDSCLVLKDILANEWKKDKK